MNLNTAADVAVLTSVIATFLSAIFALWKKIDRRQTQETLEYASMQKDLENIQAQFGPNGGGLRQAVNEIGKKIDKIEERQQAIGDKVAGLAGKFEQHIEEQND
jgi:hypothetical protein